MLKDSPDNILETINNSPNLSITPKEVVNTKTNFILMGLDLSPKYCGLAITDNKRIATKGLFTIRWNKKNYKKFLYQINETAKLNNVNGFVIGLPVNIHEVLPQSKNYIKSFGHNLKQITGLPYFFQDENLSTVMATSFLRGDMNSQQIRSRQNEIAASYILQSFLEEHRDITNLNNNNN